MTKWRIDGAPVDAAIEIERFASFDYQTRRFVAFAIAQVPELVAFVGEHPTHAGNRPASFDISDQERDERARAYSAISGLRSCREKGVIGQQQRRMQFGALLQMAIVDLRWKRLTTLSAFVFCYERLLGGQWRELLPLCWNEASVQRRKKRGPLQLQLVSQLKDDQSVPNLLEDDRPPMFYPSMADADAIGSPLLAGL